MLLLDEPLAALDKKLRESTQLELMELQRRLGMTFIIVTHDQEEAMTMADRIGVMDAGRLEQVATPRELYEAPASRWVAEFVGDINLFEGEVDVARTASPDGCDPGRRNHRGRGAAPARHQDRRHGRDPPREGQTVAPRPGVGRDQFAVRSTGSKASSPMSAISAARPSTRSSSIPARCVRSSMANTARIDSDAYSAGQRVVAWFTPDDCVVLEQ